ncbi:MAG: hypothetical protein WA058_02235 [Minisyncoccia bacterium]
MWGDLFLLPALMAYVVVNYGDEWTAQQVVVMAIIGMAITLGNHLLLIFTQEILDPLGWKHERWSTLIALHFVYMSAYVALVGLFFFCSPGVSVVAAITVATILGVHMALGTHVPLGVMERWYQWDWCPDLLGNPGLPWMQLGLWVVLAMLAWYAAGWQAGLWVAAIAIALAGLVVRMIPPTVA